MEKLVSNSGTANTLGKKKKKKKKDSRGQPIRGGPPV
jgi:hypothetical protein